MLPEITSVFSSTIKKKPNISNFQFDPESKGHWFVSHKAVNNNCYPC